MNGGSLQSQYIDSCRSFRLVLAFTPDSILKSDGNYLFKAVRGFQNQGFSVHAISIQVRFLGVEDFSNFNPPLSERTTE